MTRRKNLRIAITVISLLVSSLATAQSDSKPRPTGSISGRITNHGKPAAGIPVAAVAGQSVNQRDAPARAYSDIDGNYQITGLKDGEYQVWTMTPSMVADPATSPNYSSYAGAAKSVLLGADESVTGVDLKIIRGAVITGRVTNADNKPVIEERVKLQLLDANGNPRFGTIGSAYDQMYQTDDRGVYRVFDLPPGRYRVSVGYDAATDGLTRAHRYDQTFYLDPTDQTKPAIVELSEGDEARNIDIRVGATATTFSVSGRVIDAETGLPIGKAGVSFSMVSRDKNNRAPGITIQSDDSGQFQFQGFAPGHYLVTPNARSYGGGNFYGDPVSFEVTDKDVTGLEVRTVPGLTLSGYVSATGLSTKELMSVLPNLVIMANGLTPANTEMPSGGRSTIAPDGTFEIGGLRPGPVSMWITTQRPSALRTNINRMERDGVPVNQNFEMRESLSGLHVEIDYGTGVVRGTVKLEGSEVPITDSRMSVSCKREGARDGNPVQFAQVDARGHFVMTNLGPGRFEFTLVISGLGPRPPLSIPPQKHIVNITNGEETEVTFIVNLGPNAVRP